MGGRNQVMRMPKSTSIRELVGGGATDTHLQLFIMLLIEFQQSAMLEAGGGQHMAVAAVTSFLCFTHGEDG